MNENERKELEEAVEKLRKKAAARTLFDVAENGDVFLIANPKIRMMKDSIIAENLTKQIYVELNELLEKTMQESKKLAERLSDPTLSADAQTLLIQENQEMFDVVGQITDRLVRVSAHVKQEPEKESKKDESAAGDLVEDEEREDTSEKDIIDYGSDSAKDLVTNPNKEAKVSEEEKEKQKKTGKISLLDGFVKSDLKGEDISLESGSIRDKIYLVAEHTGYKINADDPVLVSSYNKYANQFKNNLEVLPASIRKHYKARYGKDWKEAIMASYKQGWDRQMQKEIDDAYDKGIESRDKALEGKKEPETKSSPLAAAMEEKKETKANPDREYAHQLGQRLDAAEAENKRLSADNEELRKANAELTQKLKALESENINQAEKLGKTLGENEALRGIIAVKDENLAEHEQTIKMQRSEISRLTNNVEDLKGALHEAKSQGQQIAWDLYNERQLHAAEMAKYQKEHPGTPFYTPQAVEASKVK